MELPELDDLLKYENENVIFRFQKLNPKFSNKEAREIFDETLKWIWLSAKSTIEKRDIELIIDSIDEMWHTFILSTIDYCYFCQVFFNEYVHHIPLRKKQYLRFIVLQKSNLDLYEEIREKQIKDTMTYISANLGEDRITLWFIKFKNEYDPKIECKAL